MDVIEKPPSSDEESFNSPPISDETPASQSLPQNEEDDAQGPAADPFSYIQDLIKEIENTPEMEQKVQRVIDFMEKSLAQTGSPHFKSFWQARGLCLQLFKENISPAVRAVQWNRYTELSKEARRLKDLLDEQSAFAVEQIEIAIKAIENDLSQETPAAEERDLLAQSLKHNHTFYTKVQGELDYLNQQASRINALRKELIKTEMRIRKKNKFFQRLSQLGDKVFPRRKELIQELSNSFMTDVDAFISKHFAKADFQDSLFFLREEIKALQGAAKLFTLNTHVFTQTRMRLSECWDKIKNEEKERKKVRSQQKTAFKANMDAVLQKIEECKKSNEENPLPPAEANKKFDEVVAFMRSVELGRDEVNYLREQISIARQPLLDLLKSEEQKRIEQEQERQRQKQQKIHDIKLEIDLLIRSVDVHDAAELAAQRDAILEKIQTGSFIKSEKQELERLLKPLRDIIADKKAMSLTALSDDDKQALQQLKDVLQERRALRQEIKEQLETLRKALGSSKLDFERAMEYNAQMHAQKERLEKINAAVTEIENKISALES